jgi:hypothetical protein
MSIILRATVVKKLTIAIRDIPIRPGRLGPRYAGRRRCSQILEKRCHKKYPSIHSDIFVYIKKRIKCGNVVIDTQFLVQGQWWSIFGTHLAQ